MEFAYSLDLTFSKLFRLSELKTWLTGKKFDDDEDEITETEGSVEIKKLNCTTKMKLKV